MTRRRGWANLPQEKIDDGPDPIDIHVGARMRLRRTMLGMSQGQLGEAIGLMFQQIQKYEKGTNRIAASRLWDLSLVLDVPISYFYDDARPEIVAGRVATVPVTDPMRSPQTRDLIATFYRIPDPAIRQVLLRLICAAGGTEAPAEPTR